jgi:hypothetical protein
MRCDDVQLELCGVKAATLRRRVPRVVRSGSDVTVTGSSGLPEVFEVVANVAMKCTHSGWFGIAVMYRRADLGLPDGAKLR